MLKATSLRQKFTKALVLSGGASVVEVDVGHAAREGSSRYTPLRLTRLARALPRRTPYR
jgi:hypothetical protein